MEEAATSAAVMAKCLKRKMLLMALPGARTSNRNVCRLTASRDFETIKGLRVAAGTPLSGKAIMYRTVKSLSLVLMLAVAGVKLGAQAAPTAPLVAGAAEQRKASQVL